MIFNEPEENLCSSAESVGDKINHPWDTRESSVGMILFRKYLFRFILPQIAQIFTDFLLLGQQLLADEWMCSPHGNNLCASVESVGD